MYFSGCPAIQTSKQHEGKGDASSMKSKVFKRDRKNRIGWFQFLKSLS